MEFIVKPNSLVCDKKIKDIEFPRSAIIGGVIRDKTGLIALGDFVIQAGDRIVVCCLPQALNKVEELFL